MKKITSLIFAVVSTMFLAAGATHAAEKFDGLMKSAVSGPVNDGPTTPPPPCVIIDEPME